MTQGPQHGSAAADLLPMRYGLLLVTTTSVLTGVLLAITAVSGLVFGARGLYRPDPATLPTFLGQDAITLLVVLPLLLGSTWAARRGSLRGLLLWSAGLFYVAYSYAYYVLDPEFNWLYLAYIAIVAMSMYSCLYLLLGIDSKSVAERFDTGTPVGAPAAFLMLLSVALGAAWISMILADLSSGKMPSRVDQVVWPMDLVVAFPAMFWAGLWLWRRQPLGYVVAAILLVKGGLLGVTLVVNTWIATTFWDAAPDPIVPVYALGGCGGLALAWWYLRHVRAAGLTPLKEPMAEMVHEPSARRANA
jgi:hypothetical protein